MSKLVLFLPDGTTLDVPLDRERMTIGRRADNEICLPNLAVSGEHAVVVTILADSFLEDLGSTNGTLVNGKPVAKHFLRDRDEIDIGRHKLVYCADDNAVLEPGIVKGMARVADRDFGGRVELAKSPGRGQREMAALAADDSPASPQEEPAPAGDPVPAAVDARTPIELSPPAQPLASIKILTGANVGLSVPLIKDETTIGRPGVQVAAIVKDGNSFVLKRIEGRHPPVVNNQPVPEGGAALANGDVIAIAGRKIEFVATDAARADPDLAGESAGASTTAESAAQRP
ncbi:MAG TPA: FHA domain-containing protein [Casimicrobiaceae bacterium]|nr:FHA domain-containing protein [Casimicrobiaceae bacterium]